MDAKPIATPTISRPNINDHRSHAKPMTREPTTKMADATKMTILRPYLSVK